MCIMSQDVSYIHIDSITIAKPVTNGQNTIDFPLNSNCFFALVPMHVITPIMIVASFE